jgi:hypothetical protein
MQDAPFRTQSPHNELPSTILNNMKGRALSLENHADLRSTDPAMTIAWAFSPDAVHLAAERSAGWRSGELNAPQGRHLTQPLIHHHKALPIFAAFGLRYIHDLVRKWAALGTCSGCAPQVGMRPAGW